MVYTHRLVFILTTQSTIPDGMSVDHVDGNPRNVSSSNLRLVSTAENNRNVKQNNRNTSGVTGVSKYTDKRGYSYYQVCWREDTKRYMKTVSVQQYGEDEAFRLACAYREEQINRLNNLGYGYTGRHGT